MWLGRYKCDTVRYERSVEKVVRDKGGGVVGKWFNCLSVQWLSCVLEKLINILLVKIIGFIGINWSIGKYHYTFEKY